MNPNVEFWNYFQEASADLERSEETSLRKLYLHLTEIDKRLYLHTGRKDNGEWDLILSAEGVPELVPILENLVANAPMVRGWGYVPCYDGEFLFGQRNEQLYPEDANGNTLYRMVRGGDRPWISREVNFSVVFPDEEAADGFLARFDSEGSRCEKDAYTGADGFTFEVTITRAMCPNYSNIAGFEEKIALVADEFGGRNDGWGCFRMNDSEQVSSSDGVEPSV